jgi:hypothetical protein
VEWRRSEGRLRREEERAEKADGVHHAKRLGEGEGVGEVARVDCGIQQGCVIVSLITQSD